MMRKGKMRKSLIQEANIAANTYFLGRERLCNTVCVLTLSVSACTNISHAYTLMCKS